MYGMLYQISIENIAQLTYPAVGKGPYPGVLLIHGSGPNDKNETAGFVHKSGPKPPTPPWQIAQYLSERGFAVLRYDKRGVGANFTVDQNVWGNTTVNDLIHDAEKALNVLIQQPEVDAKRISLIGHSEGTVIAPRVAVDNPTKVKNIVLIAAVILFAPGPLIASHQAQAQFHPQARTIIHMVTTIINRLVAAGSVSQNARTYRVIRTN
jgi:pimeloyl-ACP methyl ester carboxylesterase